MKHISILLIWEWTLYKIKEGELMERHIGIWNKEGTREHPEVGELIIDDNLIEFYSRLPVGISASTYIGSDG